MAAISNYYGMRAATYHEIDPQYMKLQLKPYWYLYSTIFCFKNIYDVSHSCRKV